MQETRHPPLPSREELDRIAPRYFVVPLLIWAAGLLAVVLSASLPTAGVSTVDAAPGEPATVAYGA